MKIAPALSEMGKPTAREIMSGKPTSLVVPSVEEFEYYGFFTNKFNFCFRMFGTKCEKCGSCFRKNDYVMRARSKIFHMECFRCVACERQLVPGKFFSWLHHFRLFTRSSL